MSKEMRIAKLYVGLEDKIGLSNYSSATAMASVSREIEDPGGDEALQIFAAELRKMAEEVLEPFIAAERQNILDTVQGNVGNK